MPSPNFIDYVKLHVCSGDGGSGSIHFRRARYIPKGGPDGGNGGRGGDVYLLGQEQLSTLLHLKYTKKVKAPNGIAGSGNNAQGASGNDIWIKVPLGTVAKEEATGITIGEITENNQKLLLAQGGRGGLGNDHFKSATRQTPRYAQPGEKGEEKLLILELKLIADIGLVGLPNAGKSTLLTALSNATPRIAPYPFTTLTPQLGIVSYYEHSFVAAEIPGLIQGAAQGKGLGIRFLRHAERAKTVLFVIPADSEDYGKIYYQLCQELYTYNPAFQEKKQHIILSKKELISPSLLKERLRTLPTHLAQSVVSAHTQEGLEELKKEIYKLLSP